MKTPDRCNRLPLTAPGINSPPPDAGTLCRCVFSQARCVFARLLCVFAQVDSFHSTCYTLTRTNVSIIHPYAMCSSLTPLIPPLTLSVFVSYLFSIQIRLPFESRALLLPPFRLKSVCKIHEFIDFLHSLKNQSSLFRFVSIFFFIHLHSTCMDLTPQNTFFPSCLLLLVSAGS
jgi:hypothetical protein